ncbi:hypothetical protein EVAR_46456_1 [Eumeta japonica]|uniref:Uncharacterized protein n=1 Tax=Eumeta variegata TaxID=151549 RepID=A0A4C1XK18_EUMVA|nr:hypothetical protein EVAR_46456_1 [Eumeta japonica]
MHKEGKEELKIIRLIFHEEDIAGRRTDLKNYFNEEGNIIIIKKFIARLGLYENEMKFRAEGEAAGENYCLLLTVTGQCFVASEESLGAPLSPTQSLIPPRISETKWSKQTNGWTDRRTDKEGLMMEFPNFQLRYQTLKGNHGRSVFHDNINKPKHGYAALFNYGVLILTFRFHHQTLKITHSESAFQDNSDKLKHD